MARSDNVVRVALTPKHRDVPLLCEILTYGMGAPPIVQPVVVDHFCCRYTPPIKDFEMLDIEVRRNIVSAFFTPFSRLFTAHGPTSGSGQKVKNYRGSSAVGS